MKNLPIDWDSVPDVMNKDQFYRLCHISKSTALHLLKSGKVPCEWTGKKTRCYKIKKEDVRAYLEERAVYPELYSAPRGWYGDHYVAKLSKELPEDVLRQMHGYYAKLLSKYKFWWRTKICWPTPWPTSRRNGFSTMWTLRVLSTANPISIALLWASASAQTSPMKPLYQPKHRFKIC